MRRLARLLAIFTICATVLLPAIHGHTATVSVEEGDGFDRIRFDWRSRVEYSAQRFGNALLLEFARPVRSDIAEAAVLLEKFVASARRQEGGREVVVELTAAHRFRTFRDGNAVVVMVGSKAALARASRPEAAAKSVT